MCRYGHQDVYRLLGRDAAKEPLDELETVLFTRALEQHVQAEFEPRADLSFNTTE